MTRKRAKPRDELWDALLDILGFKRRPGDDEAGPINSALKSLKQSGATVPELYRRAVVYETHPGWEKKDGTRCLLTAKALSKNWTLLGKQAEEDCPTPRASTRISAPRGKYNDE